MKRSLKELKGYSLKAIDGEKGKVKNFLFDEEEWTVRYIEVELGNFFRDKRVLIPKEFFGEPDWNEKVFPVQLTVEMIKNSPDLGFDLPVSRKYEANLLHHYEIKPYWPETVATYSGRESMFDPGKPFKAPQKSSDEEELDTRLRSFNEIKGYYINALDERFGHIDDLIMDDDGWRILYVIIDTKNIVPWGKDVMLPVEVINNISYFEKEAVINLPKDTIKNAPEYNPAMAINAEYEKVLYDFYGRKIIK
jgi:uncharacterized protein YrrD